MQPSMKANQCWELHESFSGAIKSKLNQPTCCYDSLLFFHLLSQAERGIWMWKCRGNMEEKGSDWKRASKYCGHRQDLNQNTLYWAGRTTLSIQGLQWFNPVLRKLQRVGRRGGYLLYHKNTVQDRPTISERLFFSQKKKPSSTSAFCFIFPTFIRGLQARHPGDCDRAKVCKGGSIWSYFSTGKIF